jgi:hypothetical protein
MRRAEDGVGIGEAVRAYLYCTWLPKESRKPGGMWRVRLGRLQPQQLLLGLDTRCRTGYGSTVRRYYELDSTWHDFVYSC